MEKSSRWPPMVVISEEMTYGYEGDPHDDFLSSDETLVARLEGSMAPGETVRYTPQQGCKGARFIHVRAGARQGPRKPPLIVRIVTDFPIDGVVEGEGEQCIKFIVSRRITPWYVEVVNPHNRDRHVAHLWIRNTMELGQSCFNVARDQ